MLHELKTWPEYFAAVYSGMKNFEVRKDDRGFIVGDELLLKEYFPDGHSWDGSKEGFTGRILHRRVDYILKGNAFGIQEGYVVMGLTKL